MTNDPQDVDPGAEFAGIFEPGHDRPVCSKPPRKEASRKLISDTRAAFALHDIELDDNQATWAADWLADKLERFGAATSKPVFDMNGIGPVCSWCDALWPLCGHHHQSAHTADQEELS